MSKIDIKNSVKGSGNNGALEKRRSEKPFVCRSRFFLARLKIPTGGIYGKVYSVKVYVGGTQLPLVSEAR